MHCTCETPQTPRAHWRRARAGTDAKALVEQHVDSVYGVVFPYTQLPARKKWGQAVLLKNLGEFLNGARPAAVGRSSTKHRLSGTACLTNRVRASALS